MAKPTFIYVGPGRTATSWLQEMLQSHPDVGLSRVKETEFFNNNYDRGIDWYEDMFPSEDYKARGEISTMYYIDKDVPARIAKDYPNIKILFGARDPLELLESFYQFGARRGVAAPTIEQSLNQPNAIYMGSGYKARLAKNSLSSGDKVSMIDSVRIAQYLDYYYSVFGKENVLVVSFDKITKSPAAMMKDIYEFIGVNNQHNPAGLNEKINPSVEPKSKLLALAAHRLAYFLRKVGLHKLLSTLHQSRLIKNLLFKENSKGLPKQTLPIDIVQSLAKEALMLKDLINSQKQSSSDQS